MPSFLPINLNDLAKEVCEAEGGKVEVNIAQVADVLSALFSILAKKYTSVQVLELRDRYRTNKSL